MKEGALRIRLGEERRVSGLIGRGFEGMGEETGRSLQNIREPKIFIR